MDDSLTPQPTPRWKRICAFLAALAMIFLTLISVYALATGQLFWI